MIVKLLNVSLKFFIIDRFFVSIPVALEALSFSLGRNIFINSIRSNL